MLQSSSNRISSMSSGGVFSRTLERKQKKRCRNKLRVYVAQGSNELVAAGLSDVQCWRRGVVFARGSGLDDMIIRLTCAQCGRVWSEPRCGR